MSIYLLIQQFCLFTKDLKKLEGKMKGWRTSMKKKDEEKMDNGDDR